VSSCWHCWANSAEQNRKAPRLTAGCIYVTTKSAGKLGAASGLGLPRGRLPEPASPGVLAQHWQIQGGLIQTLFWQPELRSGWAPESPLPTGQ
jgi:hypothetical protein